MKVPHPPKNGFPLVPEESQVRRQRGPGPRPAKPSRSLEAPRAGSGPPAARGTDTVTVSLRSRSSSPPPGHCGTGVEGAANSELAGARLRRTVIMGGIVTGGIIMGHSDHRRIPLEACCAPGR
eukprot:111875-Hanusia_phi.AAC.3